MTRQTTPQSTLKSDLNAALAPLNEGRNKSALKAAKSGMRRHPSHPAFANVAGIAACALGKQRDGIVFFRKALALDPDFQDARRNMAQTLILMGHADKAEAALQKLVAAQENDAGGWYLLAQARLEQGDLKGAMAAADRTIALAPKAGRGFNLRAVLHERAGRVAAAVADYEEASTLNPSDVEALVNISLPLARQTRFEDALAAVSRAVALAPAHVGARLRLGDQLAEMGRRDAAIEAYRALLDHHPGHAAALARLADLLDAEAVQDLTPAIQTALKKTTRRSEDRAGLCFAAARLAAKQDDGIEEARWLGKANADMAALLPYDAKSDAALVDRILSPFSDAVNAHDNASPASAPGPRPIYVVGLPRSGTTLTEAILGAHPSVAPLGERAAAGAYLYPMIDEARDFDAQEIAAFLRHDASLIPQLPTGTDAYVDKMPENYRLAGYLLTADPRARMIALTRDPRDVALSMWRGHFSGSALSYTYDLRAMAHRFNLYARMMDVWRTQFPDRILDLPYEALVSDVEAASRDIAAFCELDWCAAMARPDLSAEQVLTLSADQLRQPVHTRSIGKWRQHEDMLAPFIDGLDPELWPGLT